jgi:translation initiation factor eIF-2B subunit alpha
LLQNLDEWKAKILARGERFVAEAHLRREKIGQIGLKFIKNDTTILIHSYSRVVMHLLQKAAESGIQFNVLVTESRPSAAGFVFHLFNALYSRERVLAELQSLDIPTQIILDAAVGYYIEKVDMILVGAEGVVESGGIINQIGTYQIAVVAKAARKPFYVVVESFKFARLFPINQYDLPRPKSTHNEDGFLEV